MCCRRGLSLYRGRQGSSSLSSPPRLTPTRVHADEACSATLAGWLLSWCGGRVFTKICMPPCRCLLSWPGSCTSPRRCLPCWRVDCCVGTAVEPWQVGAWLRPRRCPRQGSCQGLAGVAGKGLAGGLVSVPGKDLAGVSVFWFSSSLVRCWSLQRSACHHASTSRALVPVLELLGSRVAAPLVLGKLP